MGQIIVDNGKAKVTVVTKQGIPGSGVSQTQLDNAITAHENASPAHPSSAISHGGGTVEGALDGKLAIASDLSDLASAATARDNLGLGDAATQDAMDLPVSVFQQDALDLKADIAALELLETALDLKADTANLEPFIWLPASAFDRPSTTPVLETVGLRKAYKFNESWGYVACQRIFPPNWLTYHVDFYWARIGAEAAGDVRFRWDRQLLAVGGDVTSTGVTTSPMQTFAAPTQNQMAIARVANDIPVSAGSLTAVTANRFGLDALDTFTGAVHLFFVLLTRAS